VRAFQSLGAVYICVSPLIQETRLTIQLLAYPTACLVLVLIYGAIITLCVIMLSNSTSAVDRQHESQAGLATTVLVVSPAVSAFFIAMRIYTRGFLVKKCFWDDYTVVAAWVWEISAVSCLSLPSLWVSQRLKLT
jgi:hypothetical protein